MKTRVIILILALACLLSATAAAQGTRWKMLRSAKWGFSYQVPLVAIRQNPTWPETPNICDVFRSPGLAFIIEVTQTPPDALASTTIEKIIQAELKQAAKLGKSSRWEVTSKQGGLFKGFTSPVQLDRDSPVHGVVIKAIGGVRGVESVALCPLGDESSPIVRITVVGIGSRESEVASMAKQVAELVSSDTLIAAQAPGAEPKPTPSPKPAPAPKPEAKPWPALKSGQIELAGTVDSVSADGKTVNVTVTTVKVIGQDPITLSPARSKKVLLKAKLTWLTQGQHVRLIGKNSGEGKPITAEAIEQIPAPSTGPPGPAPIS